MENQSSEISEPPAKDVIKFIRINAISSSYGNEASSSAHFMKIANFLSLHVRICAIAFDLIVSCPEGFEDMCEEELKEKCSNVEIKWIGRGAIRFSTTTKPTTIISSMRSIHQLAAYLHHFAPFDNVNMSAEDLCEALVEPYAKTIRDAVKVWGTLPTESGAPRIDPVEQQLETTYRMTTERRGAQKFTSMDVSRECASAIIRALRWKAKMKGYDIEVLITILDDQLWSGIALHDRLLSTRNRTVLGKTTLSAAVCYCLARYARIMPQELVIDPMAGVGSIPIEASQTWTKARFIAGDINKKDCEAALVNATAHAVAPVSVVRWDATSLPLRDASVDVVLTDMPFGHRQGSHLINQKVYPRFLRELWRVLVPETGRALLITMARNVVKTALAVQMRKGNWQLRTEKYVDVGGFRATLFEILRKEALPMEEGSLPLSPGALAADDDDDLDKPLPKRGQRKPPGERKERRKKENVEAALVDAPAAESHPAASE